MLLLEEFLADIGPDRRDTTPPTPQARTLEPWPPVSLNPRGRGGQRQRPEAHLCCIGDSITASPYESEGLGPRGRVTTPSEHPQDRIEHGVQFLAHILGKKAQHEVAVLL